MKMKFVIIFLILIISICILNVLNVKGNNIDSIIENQNTVHKIANYARASNFKNQTLIVEKLSEVWMLLEDEKHPTKHRYSEIVQNISQAEKDTIARLVWLEARGESDEGQRAVIEVVLNRVLNKNFPNTILNVIYQNNPIQFVPASQIPSATATQKEYANLEYVLSGKSFVTEESVVFFSKGLQKGRQLYKKIGNHYFQYI